MKNHIPITIFALALFLGVGLSHKISQINAPAPEMGLSPYLGATYLSLYPPEIEAELRYTARMEAWLDTLETYENCPAGGIVDSNKQKSYGVLCYQSDTYLMFMRVYGSQCMPSAEEGEWINNLSDRSTQRCLTRLVIEADHSAWRNWWTSVKVRNMGEPPKPIHI